MILYTGLAKIQKELEEVGRVYTFILKGLNKTPLLQQAKGIVKAS